jgi:hypothetical protein
MKVYWPRISQCKLNNNHEVSLKTLNRISVRFRGLALEDRQLIVDVGVLKLSQDMFFPVPVCREGTSYGLSALAHLFLSLFRAVMLVFIPMS